MLNSYMYIAHKRSRCLFEHNITLSPGWGAYWSVRGNRAKINIHSAQQVLFGTLTLLSYVFVNGSVAAAPVQEETDTNTDVRKRSTRYVFYHLALNNPCGSWHFNHVWIIFILVKELCLHPYLTTSGVWWEIDPLFACSDFCAGRWTGVSTELLICHTVHTHTSKSLMVVSWPGESHLEQTVMRKGITVFHQQLSPVATVSIKCTCAATGHAVAKEVLVSKQELARKRPPKLIQEIGCRWSWFWATSIFHVCIVGLLRGRGKLPGHL